MNRTTGFFAAVASAVLGATGCTGGVVVVGDETPAFGPASACWDTWSSVPTGCNDLVNDGPCAPEIYVAGPSPAPQGGIIVDGMYDVTSAWHYQAPVIIEGDYLRGTLRISGGGTLLEFSGSVDSSDSNTMGVVSTSGSLFTADTACLGGPALTWQYTATPSQFSYWAPGLDYSLAYVENYTRRP